MDCLNKILSTVTYLIHNFSVLTKNFLHLLSCKITTKQENLEIIIDYKLSSILRSANILKSGKRCKNNILCKKYHSDKSQFAKYSFTKMKYKVQICKILL